MSSAILERLSTPGRLVAVATLAVAVWLGGSSAKAASFEGLGFLSGGSMPYSQALDVSADGSVVVGQSRNAQGDDEAFRWEGGVMSGLDDLAGGRFFSTARGVSAEGTVIVGASISDFGLEAFRWEGGAMEGLGGLRVDTFRSVARGVSADGSVVVGTDRSDSVAEGFRWEDGVMSGVGFLPDSGSVANAVSADGLVVVGNSAREAFRWEDGAMTGLGDLPGGNFQSDARAVNADGTVIVGHSFIQFGIEAFRWENGVMTSLGDLPGGNIRSEARDVSADGTVVVGRSSSDSGIEAFLWDAGSGIRSLKKVLTDDFGLDLTGWTLTEATSISADGTVIVGKGRSPDNNEEGWIARLTAAPYRWADPSDGVFGEASNWNPQGVPGESGTAIFDVDGTYTVSLSEDRTHETTEVRTGSVTFATGSNRYLLRSLQIGGTPDGPVSVTVPSNAANDSGVDADEIIVAGQSQLDTGGMVYVGDVDLPSTGMAGVDLATDVQAGHLVRVQEGSTLSSLLGWVNGPGADGSRAVVEVLGAGSSWTISNRLMVGHHAESGSGAPGEVYSSGKVCVAGGGRVEATFATTLDSGDPSQQSLFEVSGTSGGANGQPSELSTATLTVGDYGRAALTADGGAVVRADVLNVGLRGAVNGGPPSHGTVLLEGAGTRLESYLGVAPNINVGRRGDAGLIVRDGAYLTGLLTVGFSNAGEGAAAIAQIEGRGGGTPADQQTSAYLPAISLGTGDGSVPGWGELHITAGAQVEAVDVDVATASPAGGRAALSVDGQDTLLDVDNRINVGGGSPGRFNVTNSSVVNIPVGVLTVENNGTVELRSGARLTAGGVNIHPGGTVIGDAGTLAVPGEEFISNAGTLLIGSSPGEFTIEGNYHQTSDGVVELEIGGLVPRSEYDVLTITGDAIFDGQIDLLFIDGFIPHANDTFDLLEVGGLLDVSSASFLVENLGPDFEYEITPTIGGLRMTVLNDGAAMPEPESSLLAVLALVGCAYYGWRRERRRAPSS